MSDCVTKHYRETTTGDLYAIQYRHQGDRTWKVFALNSPSNPYDPAVSKCHLYSSGEVCVDESHVPRTFDRAIAIAAFWMNGYSQYVRTGEFPMESKAYNV